MDKMDDSDVLHNRRASVPSLDGFARVIVRPEVLFLLYIAAIGHAWILLSKMQVHWYGMDFSFYYTSALAMRKGLNPYTTNVMQLASRLGLHINGVPYGNDPPTFLLCFEPLTLLPPKLSYWVWIACDIVALFLSLFTLLTGRKILGRSKWAIIALIALYPPIAIHFSVASSKVFLLLCFALMMRCLEAENEIIAGFCLAMAVMLRGYPLLAAGYLICRRQWRVLFYLFVGLAIGGLITLFFCGFGVLFSFLTDAMSFLTGGEMIPFPSNLTINAFISRQFWVFGNSPVFVFNRVRLVLVLTAQIAVLGASVMATVKNASRPDRNWRAFCLWLITAIVLSPIGYMHDMVLVIPLMIQLVIAARSGDVSRRAIWLAIASYLVPAVMGAVAVTLDHFGFLAHLTPIVGVGVSRRIWLLMREFAFFSLTLAYLSAYFFTIDEGHNLEQASEGENRKDYSHTLTQLEALPLG